MDDVYRVGRVTVMLLLCVVLAACSMLDLPAAAGPSPTAAPPTQPMADTGTTAQPSGVLSGTAVAVPAASGHGWNLLGRLALEGASDLSITTLAVEPITPTTIYAGTSYTSDNRIGVYRSADGGRTWQPAGAGLPVTTEGTGVSTLVSDPHQPSTLYAIGAFNGLWRSADGGQSWHVAGLADKSVSDLVIDPGTPPVLYALTREGVQRSGDDGASWQATSSGLPQPTDVVFDSLRIDPQHLTTLYIGTSFGGVFRTTDGGAHWSAASTGLPDKLSIDGLSMSMEQPTTLYLSIVGTGLYHSGDGGAHWSKSSADEYVQVTPVNEEEVFAILNRSLARSTDGGVSWQPVEGVDCGAATLQRGTGPAAMLYVGCGDGRIYALK